MNYALSERWKLYAQYTYLQMHLEGEPSLQGDGNSPRNQVYLRSSWNLGEDVDFDLMARYVDALSYYNSFTNSLWCSSYIEMDLRLAWRPRKNLELAVVGQNLLDNHHYEFVPTQNVFAQVTEP